ncbi:GAF domain-containing sensor histidine kinase [Thalassobaculum salexigens]|uniref:GAF domain-containing sensor histidine kinase n=1 Tax=Thalassobaculum salexigens TaxID=455360 RepID=UPI000A00D7FC|nr:GAF domain-containing protein [Thalassobaculum salexigens]
MLSVPLPSNEKNRLTQLIWFQILDTPPEEGFDRIARMAARVMDTPISAVSLVDRDRQWFKSACGLSISETERDVSFCSYAILQRTPMVVEDTLEDPRFKKNPLVIGAPHIRAYAGVPLITEDGFALGSLCAVDTRPRHFTDDQMEALKDLAETTMDLMRYRLLRTNMQQATGMFSSQVSHEIRTPLNAIVGFSEALCSGVYDADPQRARDYLDIIARAGRDLDETLGRLLDEPGDRADKL